MARYPTGRGTLLRKKRTATSAPKLKGKVHKKSSRARRRGPQKGKKLSPRALTPARGNRRGRNPHQGLVLLNSSANEVSGSSGMRQGRSRSEGALRRPAPGPLTRKRPAAGRGHKGSLTKKGRNRSNGGRRALAPGKGMPESPAKRGGRKPRRPYPRGG